MTTPSGATKTTTKRGAARRGAARRGEAKRNAIAVRATLKLRLSSGFLASAALSSDRIAVGGRRSCPTIGATDRAVHGRDAIQRAADDARVRAVRTVHGGSRGAGSY